MNFKKPKAIIFFQYLPPWRIDVFNEMAKYYQLTIVYTNAETEGFKYDREDLLNRLDKDIENIFLTNGFKIGKRPIRLGIFKLIKTIKPDIVFSHEYSPVSIILATFLKLNYFNFQYVITTSDNTFISEGVKGVKFFFRKYVLSVADALVVYSKAVKEFYKGNFSGLRVEICPNIQNPDTLLEYRQYFPSILNNYINKFGLKESKIILYTGRLENVKGLDLLLEAFAKSMNSGFKIVLVGDGNEKENLKQKCKDLNIEDQVIFAGFCSGKELYAWYDLANFYVLPSRFEPFGAVVNEALVFGCPVMASKYIGAVDFVNRSNGLLFDPLNEHQFVENLNIFYERTRKLNSKEKMNLMPVSFSEYVKVFYEIYKVN
ncbi:glycosyltransferase [Maribacter sp. TH_r10]|uniref:glycosyltransferase n=1 Tax=Maribacter sp. TH_r10 TaxID=3082086 RepID=UPI002954BC05|nr:glycosyltransferase [Maribacter sp. TH_r10]MDV7140209.1 glycosyltransferase [Maribacter sp. TH_r10]